MAPPGSVVFVEGQLRPRGALKSDVDALAEKLTGEASFREYVISELEESVREDGGSLDFASEVEPWLGDRGAVAFERVAEGELSEPLIAVETTDAGAAQAFAEGKGRAKENVVGVVGDALVIADGEREFEAAVDASEADSLGDESRFQDTMELGSNGSLADIYVDVGALVKQTEDDADAPTKEALQSAGIDPSDATAVASVIPDADRIEVDVVSELAGEEAPSGDSSELLGSMPADAFAAVSFADFNEQFEEAIDNLDEEGVPPDLKPGELKSALQQAGVDVDGIAASLDEGAVFAEGGDKASLGGAMVVTAKSSEAADAIGSLGRLLRAASVPGITAVSGEASGFSIRSDTLGDKALVVVGKGNRIALGYGLAPALAGLNAGSGATLSGTPAYKAAVAALGGTPISGFVDGPGALGLAEALVPRSESDFWEAVPYLKRIGYIGIGRASASDEIFSAKLIAGVGK